ncbi:hypothetical protein CERSUDRAFT_112710 [Gelatoporia subvermispora B]|uniref:Uncharacterized protein n=1 Tax=Ceriporiopsis subvermispora (strain B) TaxID=914234 RepID=M2QPN0_CERS8|nr:hypothetical protein CERSUDRAFT_112710 [Gelatoporia subvermispora B]
MAPFSSKRNDSITGTPERVANSQETDAAARKVHPDAESSRLDKPHRSQSLGPNAPGVYTRPAPSGHQPQTLDARAHHKQPRSPTRDDARSHLQAALADLRGARSVAERTMLTEPQSLPSSSSSPLASAYSLNVAIPSTGSLLSSASGSGSGSLSDASTPHPRRRPSHDTLASHAHAHLHPHAHSMHAQHHKHPTVAAPSSRKSSAASLDRDALMRLDMKRLLSKPAALGAGALSDSERAPPPLALQPRRHPSHLELGRSYLAAEKQRSKDRPSTATGAEVSPALSSHSSPNGSGSPRDIQHFPPPKSIRNVLRRKSSARSNPATPTASTFRLIPEPLSPPPPRRSPQRTSTAEVGSSTSTSVVIGMPKSPITPPDLTPAGKVAHAYKQQKQRRDKLEELSGWNDHARHFHMDTLPSGSREDVRSEKGKESEREPASDVEGENGPYYTVVGTTAGHRIAARKAQDDSWTYDAACWSGDERARATAAPRKSLTRKMSGRLRRVVRGSSDIERAPERGREWRPYDGQVLEEERRSGSTSRNARPATASGTGTVRPSVDGYVDVAREGVQSPVPSIRNGFPEKGSPDGRTLRSAKSVRGKERERVDDVSPGGRWWKLVKRISTGGLRDKYNQRPTTPPPVPALPPELKRATFSPLSRTTFEINKSPAQSEAAHGDGNVLLSRFIQSRASLSGIRPNAHAHPTPQSTPTPPKKHSMGSRPSTTTRSSSPVSSEMFHRTHSTRSSASSYGEEVPPVPQTHVAQHILSPSELHRLQSNDSVEQSPTPEVRKPRKPPARSQSAPDEQTYSTGPETFHALPLPPRRPSLGPREAHHASPREANPSLSRPPSIPSFSIDDPVNHFTPSSLPLSEFGVLPSTPPRPKRSERRNLKHIDVPSPTDVLPQSMQTPRTPRAVPSVTVDVHVSSLPPDPDLPGSARNVSSPSTASTHSSSVSQKRSPLLFRELDSPRQQWSEQEKAQKWEDLLTQSARAGGTLHIGESGLLSESTRLSVFDELDADL